MDNKREKTFCYRHPDRETRISCSECGNYICTECMIPAPVGQKCPDCVGKTESHITKITSKEYILSIICGGTVSFICSLIWNFIPGGFFRAAAAYLLGYAVAKTITSIIGNKIGFKIQVIAGTLVFVGLLYNPFYIAYHFVTKDFNIDIILATLLSPVEIFIELLSNPFGYPLWFILSIVIAIWASVRHFKL